VLHKGVDDLVLEVYALVANEMERAAKLGDYVVVQEFRCILGCVVSEYNRFDPFSGIVGSCQDVSVSCDCEFERAYKIKSPFHKRFRR
jgi:hypothetical protein